MLWVKQSSARLHCLTTARSSLPCWRSAPISLADYEPKAPSVDPHLNKIDLVPASAGLELARVWELQAPSTAEFAEWMLVLQEARELAQKRGGPPGIGAARTVHLADG